MVGLPDATACGLDFGGAFELRAEEGRQDIGQQVAGAHVDPGVFIDLAAEEAAAIGALLA